MTKSRSKAPEGSGAQSWEKKGLLFAPQGERSWMLTHAAVPVADAVDNGLTRIYFSSRDGKNRSHTGFIDLDLRTVQVLSVSAEPVLAPGKLGTFDDAGAMATWMLSHQGVKYLYYIGWNLGVSVPFRNAIGLALSRDGGRTFDRYSDGPVLDRDISDPYFTASCSVLVDGKRWRMWYLSGTRWEIEGGRPKHYYHIRYAESMDGIRWERTGVVCLDFKDCSEHAISRPCVIKEDGIYRMWYSYRGQSYRIGYAESADGIRWERKDDLVGLNVSASGWDSEMIEYPFVFDHGSRRYMLYNGNGYGKTGVGLAVLEERNNIVKA